MPRLSWTRRALEDASSIRLWLNEQASPATAATLLLRLRSQSDRLTSFPALGPALKGAARRLRIRGTPYLLIYRIIADRVEVLRIRHDREDWRDEQ